MCSTSLHITFFNNLFALAPHCVPVTSRTLQPLIFILLIPHPVCIHDTHHVLTAFLKPSRPLRFGSQKEPATALALQCQTALTRAPVEIKQEAAAEASEADALMSSAEHAEGAAKKEEPDNDTGEGPAGGRNPIPAAHCGQFSSNKL